MNLLKILFISVVLSKLLIADKQWELVWSDEFDYNGMPSGENWVLLEGYLGFNQELQRYSSNLKNAYVSDGFLRITALKEKVSQDRFNEIKEIVSDYGGDISQLGGNEITSARLVTYGKREFSEGAIAVRARFSDGRGSWPAIWLLGDESIRPWPSCGEIDIMEHVGYNPNIIHSSVHTKDYNFRERNNSTDSIKLDSVKEWHVYSVEWNEEEIIFAVDGHEYHKLKKGDRDNENWPFSKHDYYHIILNIAVGGGWGGIEGVDLDSLPYFMDIDYVRAYKLLIEQ